MKQIEEKVYNYIYDTSKQTYSDLKGKELEKYHFVLWELIKCGYIQIDHEIRIKNEVIK